VYRALYEWTGFNPELFFSDSTFILKLEKEDSIRRVFSDTMGSKGYRMNSALYFAPTKSNPGKFLVSVIIPGGSDAFSFEHRKSLASVIGIDEENVFLKENESSCWLDCQYRFDNRGGPMSKFIAYAEACPNETDLKFLNSLMTSSRSEAKEVTRAVLRIESALSNRKN
jgi:hypothetical protein